MTQGAYAVRLFPPSSSLDSGLFCFASRLCISCFCCPRFPPSYSPGRCRVNVALHADFLVSASNSRVTSIQSLNNSTSALFQSHPSSSLWHDAMFSYSKPPSLSDRRGSAFAHDELSLNNSVNPVKTAQARPPRGPPTPCLTTPAAEYDQTMTGSPPPPPTPAASPGPSHVQPDGVDAGADDGFLDSKIQQHFKSCSGPQKTRLLADLLKLCTSHELSFVHQFVSPLLKKDPFTSLPNELCLRVCPASLPCIKCPAADRDSANTTLDPVLH